MYQFLFPDHWFLNPVPTFALMETIRSSIESSDLSYRQGFPQVLDSLGLKHPKNLVGLISKINRYVSKAKKAGDFLLLCQEVPELLKTSTEIIGRCCTSLGILPNWLENDKEFTGVITNHVIIELGQYRYRKGIAWKTVVNKWWGKLFPGSEPPILGTLQSIWDNLADKKVKISRNSSEDKESFLAAAYKIPVSRPLRDEISRENDAQLYDPNDLNDNLSCDNGYDSYGSNDDAPIRRILRSHGDTMVILHELLEDERLEQNALTEELEKEKDLRKTAEEKSSNLKEELKKNRIEQLTMADQYKKHVSKYTRELKKASELSESLKKEILSLSASNVARRLKTKTTQLQKEQSKSEKLTADVEQFQKKITELKDVLDVKKRVNKNKTEQLRYHRLKRSTDQVMSEEENSNLHSQLAELEKENDQLRSDLNEIMGDQDVSTFDEGRYTEDIRVVCYELISRGVGSRHVSNIIRLVLKRIGGINCGKLPKPTLIRLMAFEQALLAKDAARNAIENCAMPATLQMDGTTKKHIPYVTMLATTDSGTYGLGLTEVRTENSEILLEETISAVQELLTITDLADNEQKVNNLLLKMKNTMTDRCIVNKKLVRLLEDWREKTLPKVVESWDSLSLEIKENMTAINDLYCGKHVVLNLQEYAGSALSDWETVESSGGKLGREKHLLWNRGNKSATLLAVRTVCEAFGPDANAQAGAPVEFRLCLDSMGERSMLKAYRGNRFNIPFENAAAVHFHHVKGHIREAHNSLPPTKQKNQLIRSVMYDLEDNIILGGIRAMGIINSHITQPLMRMLDKNDIHVMTQANITHSFMMVNPQELLVDSAVMFADFVPLCDDVHKAIYTVINEDVEFYTHQALSIILHNMFVCIKRQLEDHLPGGKYHNTGADLRQETTTCPKDNVAAERVFAGLDYLKRKSPNMSAFAMQGVLLWSQNKTAQYIDACSPEERKQLMNSAIKNRKHIVRLYQEKVSNIKVQRTKEVEERKKAQETKERQLVTQIVLNTENAIKLCGFICKTADDVDKLLQQKLDESARAALLAQIRYYKSVNRGVVKGSLFFVTAGGKQLTTEELSSRLKEILVKLNNPADEIYVETASTSASQELSNKEQNRAELKEKLLAKLKTKSSTGTKRKNPFPQDIINKRIRHTCLSPCGKRLDVYKGRVVRESTPKDIDELMEEEYRSYQEQGYTFYTIIYDPPYNQLFTYPLKKEWDDDDLLAIV